MAKACGLFRLPPSTFVFRLPHFFIDIDCHLSLLVSLFSTAAAVAAYRCLSLLVSLYNQSTPLFLDFSRQAAALSMARACGGTPGPMPRELVALLMRQYTPAGVIELVNTLSLVSMLQRWTSIYMPKQ